MNDVDICMKERDIPVKYGMINFGEEREQARTSLKYIFTDMTDIKKGYFRLGFHLNEFRICEYYKDFGYPTFEEFCEVNFEMDKGAVSRCINVFLMTTAAGEISFRNGVEIRGCAMDMSEKYKGYSYSQLTEMLPLSEEQREKVKPGMTVKQIRELKSRIMDITPEQVLAFVEYFEGSVQPFTRGNLLEEFEKYGRMYYGHAGGDVNFDFMTGKVRIHYSNYYKFNKILDYYVASGGLFEFKEVATSQPKEVVIHYNSFQDEIFIADVLYQVKKFVLSQNMDVQKVEINGKRCTFEDAKGNVYIVQYSVVKNKN